MIRRLPPGLVLGTHLAVGMAVLAWVLRRHGGPAVALLRAHVEPVWLALFAAAAVSAFLVYTRRWQLLLRGLGTAPGLASLAAFRAAGHSVSALVPSAKLGGEPVRAFLLVRDGTPGRHAIASVAVDRVLEMGAAACFGCLYGALLARRGVPELAGAMATVLLGGVALAVGVAIMVHRLRTGRGLVSAVASHTGLDRLQFVRERMDVIAGAEEDAARLVGQPGRIGGAFALGMLANAVVLVEYGLLLSAFGLPAAPLAVVAAMFAAGAAHALPIPAAVGALEGAEMWLFGILGHPPEVGLAVALAVRVRELVWMLPGLVVLAAGGVRAAEWSAR